jgi:hypothetical protein
MIHHEEDGQEYCPSLVSALAGCHKDEARICSTRGTVDNPHSSTQSQGKDEDLITGTISTKRAFFEAPEWQNCFGNTRPEQMLGVVSCKALFGAARATVFHTGIYVEATTTWLSIGTTRPSLSTYVPSILCISWSSAVRRVSSIAATSLAMGEAERYLCTYSSMEGCLNGLIMIRMWTSRNPAPVTRARNSAISAKLKALKRGALAPARACRSSASTSAE